MATPLKALLIEDSMEDAALLMRCLKRSGYTPVHERVETAEDMSAALDKDRWDIVLSDHRMPLFSALGALDVLKEKGLDLPFVIVSGNVGEELVAAAMKAGASDYVLKDDLSRLAPAVDRALREGAARREHRRAVEALRESEERFALAVRGSRDGLWDWNMLTGQIYFSGRLKEMLGFADHELCRLEELTERIHEADRAMVRAAFKAHTEQQVPFDVELRLATKQGDYRWFCARGQALWDSDGKPTRLAGSLSDLTTRKSAEAELKAQLEIIGRQQEAIRVLSAPIIEVWDGVLTVPVLGALDRERAQTILEALLSAVVRSRSHSVIIDVTGVASMDVSTAEQLVRIIRSTQLLGTQGILVGIQPPVANAIVSLGVDLAAIPTLKNLRQALLSCMRGAPAAPTAPPARAAGQREASPLRIGR
jgi:PAS domain S-box-containing protein